MAVLNGILSFTWYLTHWLNIAYWSLCIVCWPDSEMSWIGRCVVMWVHQNWLLNAVELCRWPLCEDPCFSMCICARVIFIYWYLLLVILLQTVILSTMPRLPLPSASPLSQQMSWLAKIKSRFVYCTTQFVTWCKCATGVEHDLLVLSAWCVPQMFCPAS